MGLILMILLIALFLASLPLWPYSRAWGYHGSALIGGVIGILLIMIFLAMIPFFGWYE